ncbi:PLP-dependent cysteine synthase family protein [Amycolatopsis azurea]|uniref:Cysteine synthase (O-acetylserine sulfhydylase) n=1 Tax=Amycolatopsis azurea DSM 43854 TaxID=1238180 RepID=M2Q9J0_9PSEU|nr:cysteine synthase family protein [Amycolatopsis azurea]EMD28640.1 cysteine synthase (O-acetylserine sulfhydylase) [Amycolatopsis azurea DSM 43854]
MIKDRVSDLIGRTPLLRLAVADGAGTVLLKMEQFNPTGTAKIRMARNMVDEAEEQGLLAPGGQLVEATSGNTGLGLALIAAERGYKFTAVVDNHSSIDKLRGMLAYGAELLNIAGDEEGLATAERYAGARRFAAEQGAFLTAQDSNQGNPNGYRPLALELYDDLGEDIDYLYGAVGTGGSLSGAGGLLRELVPDLKIIGVEPVGSVNFGGEQAPYHQTGTGTPEISEICDVLDYDVIDEGIKVSDSEAFETCRYLARNFGILIGGSAGGVVYKALERARSVGPETTIVVLVCDGGERYLDTVFNDEWMADNGLFDAQVVDRLASMLRHRTAGGSRKSPDESRLVASLPAHRQRERTEPMRHR